ncbi:MAG TPA: type IV toxin-antitoxin system AbiEi family antitoxin domain-containing protein [Alphaproteobacteria bacterium]|nr:type IV toxin-antitoxin system AbiEi family antitoxin domain-containing protein [Alphaproteobacteria bacterium]
MDTHSRSILKDLLTAWPQHTVATSAWLEKQGVSRFLKQRYLKSGWVRSLGYGAVVRAHEKVDWPGGLWALQTQTKLPVHVGGKNAIALQGRSHYLQFGQEELSLFMPRETKLSRWFLEGKWSVTLQIVKTNFLDPTLGLNDFSLSGITIKVSSLERAALELLYLAPKRASYSEINLLFENLNLLRPDVVQELLMNCQSSKVIRLFLYLAETHQHPWFSKLNLDQISLGSGVLQLSKGGVFIKKYQMTVPKELTHGEEDAGSLF